MFTWIQNDAGFKQGDLCKGQVESLEARSHLKNIFDNLGVNVGQGLNKGQTLEGGHEDAAVLLVDSVVNT